MTLDQKFDPRIIVAIVIVIFMCIIGVTRCKAQASVDTIQCKTECIQKFIDVQTVNRPKIYALYVDESMGISDLIPVSKSVYDYILLCKQNKVPAQLGIRFRNGQITSIIRYKKKYNIKK